MVATAVVVTAVSALTILTGCGSAESRANDEARRIVIDKLYRLENSLSMQLKTFKPTADPATVTTWAPSTFRYSVTGRTVTIEFGVRGVGRDDRASLGEAVVSAGACFRVRGDQSAATIRQVDCPRSFMRAFGETVEVEVTLISRERPLAEDPS
jgi:hypothetical protein